MLVLVIGGPFGDGLKSANSTLTVHLDGHPAYTAGESGNSTTTADTTYFGASVDPLLPSAVTAAQLLPNVLLSEIELDELRDLLPRWPGDDGFNGAWQPS
jgi:hypothetical protein